MYITLSHYITFVDAYLYPTPESKFLKGRKDISFYSVSSAQCLAPNHTTSCEALGKLLNLLVTQFLCHWTQCLAPFTWHCNQQQPAQQIYITVVALLGRETMNLIDSTENSVMILPLSM